VPVLRNAGRLAAGTGCVVACLPVALVSADEGDAPWPQRTEVSVELAAAWQTRNDAAIPGDTGTRFALDELTGNGPYFAPRLEFFHTGSRRHGFRAVFAPLEFERGGVLDAPVDFDGVTFDPDTPTRGTYRFSSYRLGYTYRLRDHGDWSFWVGATLKVRDAEIALDQGNRYASDKDLGLVPLLYGRAEWRFTEATQLTLELDGLGASQGRAIDFTARLDRDLGDGWLVGLAYRTLEGGADNDDVYSFAWFHYAALRLARQF
jgi:hypothetical protein